MNSFGVAGTIGILRACVSPQDVRRRTTKESVSGRYGRSVIETFSRDQSNAARIADHVHGHRPDGGEHAHDPSMEGPEIGKVQYACLGRIGGADFVRKTRASEAQSFEMMVKTFMIWRTRSVLVPCLRNAQAASRSHWLRSLSGS